MMPTKKHFQLPAIVQLPGIYALKIQKQKRIKKHILLSSASNAAISRLTVSPTMSRSYPHIRSIIQVCVWARMIHHRGDVKGRWWRWGSSGHPSLAANMRIFVNVSHHPLLFVSKILLHSAASKRIYPPVICPVWGQEKLYNARSLSETRTWNVLSIDLNNGFTWCYIWWIITWEGF